MPRVRSPSIRIVKGLTLLDCFAVGPQTAAAARLAGFANVYSADGDGGDLARLIGERVGRPQQSASVSRR